MALARLCTQATPLATRKVEEEPPYGATVRERIRPLSVLCRAACAVQPPRWSWGWRAHAPAVMLTLTLF